MFLLHLPSSLTLGSFVIVGGLNAASVAMEALAVLHPQLRRPFAPALLSIADCIAYGI